MATGLNASPTTGPVYRLAAARSEGAGRGPAPHAPPVPLDPFPVRAGQRVPA